MLGAKQHDVSIPPIVSQRQARWLNLDCNKSGNGGVDIGGGSPRRERKVAYSDSVNRPLPS